MNIHHSLSAFAKSRSASRAACCLAICAVAGSARAQATFSFLNECGTGIWNSSCNPSAGIFRNNWGQSAASSPALVFPGVLDTANVLAGSTLTLNSTVSVATLNVPVGATFIWTGGAMTTPSVGAGVGLLNSGMTSLTVNSRNFTGTLVNSSGATVAIDLNEGNLSLNGPVAWTNNGTLSFADGTDSVLSSGTGVRTLTNSGNLSITNATGAVGAVSVLSGWTSLSNIGSGQFAVAAGAGASIGSTAFSSVPTAIWTTAAGSTFTFNGTTSGTFVGNHAGTADINGTVTLVGDTTFALQAGSPNAWRWSSGTINTGAFTLTNTGRMELTSTSRSFTGTLVNALGANILIDLNKGNVGLSNAVSWTNNGTLTFADGTDSVLVASTGSRTLTNNGTLAFVNPTGSVAANSLMFGWTSLSNTGVFSVGAGAGVTFPSTAISSVPAASWTTASNSTFSFSGTTAGTFVGNHAGNAEIDNPVTLAGDTTFALQAGSPNAWRWSSGTINTGAFTLTNTGRMELTSTSRSFTGTLVNAMGANILIDLNEGNVGLSNAVSWTNNGTLTFADGTDTVLIASTGSRTLNNNGTLAFVNPAGSVGANSLLAGWTSVANSASGIISIASGATATIATTPTFALGSGRLEGLGSFNVSGTFSTSGVIAPGTGTGAAATDIGSLTIGTGRLEMIGSGELEITLRNPTGSTQPADQTVDKLVIIDTGAPTPPIGAHTLGGTLRVRFAPGTTDVQGGIDYVIVDASGGTSSNLNGAFTQIIDANPLPGIRYSVRIVGNQAVMRVIRQCNVSDVAGGNQEPLFDGQATADDIIVFLNWFFSSDSRADYAGPNQSIGSDGAFTADDIIVFLGLYFQGCGF